ncbi:thioesterase II family protein [Amycolatopsis benzoatilytica]|uniref:thioesterase II family protein n=1 Tax=Amycolatopsis benzoatilytica TaxID=346045 RepID=UPI00036DBAD7|nr:alpha/beta fold hydrolase [Amycolatopsis benzoatilytica]
MRTSARNSDRWLRRFRPSPAAAVRLVCFPHAGGSASFYQPLAAAHAPGADVVVLQYPGRQERHREPCVPTVGRYADEIAELLSAEPELPTVYFGHSMGASIAFETALRTGAASALVVSGRRAPATRRDERFHQLDDAGLLREIRRLGGTETAALDNEEILRMSLPAIRSDYRAAETYEGAASAVLECPVIALIGDSDPKATLAEVDRWREQTTAAFRMRSFPGGHFYLITHTAAVNQEIAAELARLGNETAAGPATRISGSATSA